MSIKIKWQTLGLVATNAYLIGDTDTHEAILIDPVDEAPVLMNMADEEGWTIKLILATHAHFDHVLASQDIVQRTNAPFYIHKEAAVMLDRLPNTGIRFTGTAFPDAAQPDKFIENDEIIELGAIRLRALYTPGHAPGHLSFYMEDQQTLFSGDALFAGSIGRTDLEGGSLPLLMQSISSQLLPLADETRVLPGHMGETTIGQERKTNPYILRYLGQ